MACCTHLRYRAFRLVDFELYFGHQLVLISNVLSPNDVTDRFSSPRQASFVIYGCITDSFLLRALPKNASFIGLIARVSFHCWVWRVRVCVDSSRTSRANRSSTVSADGLNMIQDYRFCVSRHVVFAGINREYFHTSRALPFFLLYQSFLVRYRTRLRTASFHIHYSDDISCFVFFSFFRYPNRVV